MYRGPLPLAEKKGVTDPDAAADPSLPVALPRTLLTLPAAMSFFLRSGTRIPAEFQRPVREEPLRPHLRLSLEFRPGAVGKYDEAESQELLNVDFTTLTPDGTLYPDWLARKHRLADPTTRGRRISREL